jgi:hypothetical protein
MGPPALPLHYDAARAVARRSARRCIALATKLRSVRGSRPRRSDETLDRRSTRGCAGRRLLWIARFLDAYFVRVLGCREDDDGVDVRLERS